MQQVQHNFDTRGLCRIQYPGQTFKLESSISLLDQVPSSGDSNRAYSEVDQPLVVLRGIHIVLCGSEQVEPSPAPDFVRRALKSGLEKCTK
ncbi:MAG: hypothetical protein JO340_19600 [Acidobacteriaceae bacterium]|nr:hypothetical protein [Acidobacteriaceae bacterium]